MPIPAEQISPVTKMRRFAWFPGPGRLEPTSFAIGTRSTLAMVWLMKVEITCIHPLSIHSHVEGICKRDATYQHDRREDEDDIVRRDVLQEVANDAVQDL
jgi:hypothetical protein